jgi:hypothetical protein
MLLLPRLHWLAARPRCCQATSAGSDLHWHHAAHDDGIRKHFLAPAADRLAIVAAEHGLALGGHLQDHHRRSLGRVAAQRALQLCHILTIRARECSSVVACASLVTVGQGVTP